MKIYRYVFLGLLALTSISCSKEEEMPEVTLNDFMGSWSATSFVFTSKADPELSFDLIANGGELRFTMVENGGVRTWLSIATFSDEWDSQAELLGDNTLKMTPVEAARGVNTFAFELENNTLVLTNNEDSFDFTLSEAEETPATSVTTFKRK